MEQEDSIRTKQPPVLFEKTQLIMDNNEW